MLRLVLARLLQAGLVVLVVGILCFVLVRALPGDPAMRIAAGRYGPDANITEAAEHVRRELGLDQPLLVQLGASLGQLARLDLGHSVVTGLPIAKELRIQLGATLWLSGSALVLSLLLGPPIGLLAGLRRGDWVDNASLGGAIVLRSLPPTVETSIYPQADRRGSGVGFRLYTALLDILAAEDVHLAVAGVAQPNAASNALHLKCASRRSARSANMPASTANGSARPGSRS
jgi:hypothetical protein